MYVQCSKEAIQSHTRKTLWNCDISGAQIHFGKSEGAKLRALRRKTVVRLFSTWYFFLETSLVQNQQCLYNNI